MRTYIWEELRTADITDLKNGIFVWEKDDCAGHEFPLPVHWRIWNGPEVEGTLWAKSKMQRQCDMDEIIKMGLRIGGMTAEETAEWVVAKVVVAEKESAVTERMIPPCLWVLHQGTRCYLFDEVYFTGTIQTLANDGSAVTKKVCMIPFSTENTVAEYLAEKENGNYDTDEISGWPLVLVGF